MNSDDVQTRTRIAHVLFMDLVAYSRLPIEEQARRVERLRDLVRDGTEFQRAQKAGELWSYDRGDGVALAFFGEPLAAARCAWEVAPRLRAAGLPVRLGLHSGPVSVLTDINDRDGLAGGGMNFAQRVMDCGDTDHILLSQNYADILRQFEEWTARLHPVGEVEVKHGERLTLFSLHGEGVGNAATPPKAQAQAPPAVQTNLPYPRNGRFVGREGPLAAIHTALSGPGTEPTAVALTGIGGSGKTQLALEYAYAHLADYPGGVFWINARSTLHVKDDYAALGRRFFDVPDDLPTNSSAARVLDALQSRAAPTLLLLDNLTRDTDLRGDAGLNTLLPVIGPSRILVTVRETSLVPDGFQILHLPKLDAGAALALLQTYLPLDSDDERAAARQIAAHLGSLPLALVLVAEHARRLNRSYAQYWAERLAPTDRPRNEPAKTLGVLRQARRNFRTATGHDGRIYEAIALPYGDLAPPAPDVLKTAACFAARSLPSALLFEASGVPSRAEYDEAEADLWAASLLTREEAARGGAGRLTVHELVRVFAREQMSAEEHCGAVTRVVTTLTRVLREANESQDWREIRQDVLHCRDAVQSCRDLTLDRELQALLLEMGAYLTEHGELEAALSFLEEGRALAETLFGPRSREAIRFRLMLGEVLIERGDPEAARAHALTASRAARAGLGRLDTVSADSWNVLGVVHRARGMARQMRGEPGAGCFRRALSCYEKALAAFTAIHGRTHAQVAACLNNLGVARARLGDLDAALAHYAEALAIAEALHGSHHVTVAKCRNNLGRALGTRGRWDDALAQHRVALAIYTDEYAPPHPSVAASLYYIGVAQSARGETADAHAHLEESWALYQRFYPEHDVRCRAVRAALDALPSNDRAPPG